MQQLKATVEGLPGSNKVTAGPTLRREDVTEQGLVRGRRVKVNAETLRRVAGGVVDSGDADHEVTIATVRAGPNIFMLVDEEIRERAVAWELPVEEARTEGLPPGGTEELRELVIISHFHAIRRELNRTRQRTWNHCGWMYPRTHVLPKRGPSPMSREKTEWLHDHFAT